MVLITGPNYFYLLLCFDVGSGSSVDHASGGVGGVLASLPTMVKECKGSSFLIISPCVQPCIFWYENVFFFVCLEIRSFLPKALVTELFSLHSIVGSL